MQNCWREVAGERPTFSELHATFDGFLKQQTQDELPYMVVLSNPYPLEEMPSEVEETPIVLDVEMLDTTPNESNGDKHLEQSAPFDQLDMPNIVSEEDKHFTSAPQQVIPHKSQDHLPPNSTQNASIEDPSQGREKEDGQEAAHIRYVELPTRVSQRSTLPRQ